MKNDLKGVTSVIGAAALWGMQGVLSKVIFITAISPFALATYKVGIAFLSLAIGLLWAPRYFRVDRRHLPLLFVYGVVGVGLFNIFLLLSVKLNPVSTAITLIYTAPAIVSILSAIFLGEAFTKTKLLSLILTFAGCFLVVKGYQTNWSSLNLPGIGAGLAAGVTYALYSVLGKKNIQRYNYWTVMFYGLGFGSLLLLLISPPGNIFAYTPATQLNILLLAVGTTLVANLLYALGLTYLEASKASMVATLEPVVAVLLAVVILNEPLEWLQVLGFLLVMYSVYLLTKKQRQPHPTLLSDQPDQQSTDI